MNEMTGYYDTSFKTETTYFALGTSLANFLASIWCVFAAFQVESLKLAVGLIIVAYTLQLISFNCLEEIHE